MRGNWASQSESRHVALIWSPSSLRAPPGTGGSQLMRANPGPKSGKQGADPRFRLGAGAARVLITAHAARADTVGRGEARAFRAVNGLPASLYPPLWLIMQSGALGAVLSLVPGESGRWPRREGANASIASRPRLARVAETTEALEPPGLLSAEFQRIS